MCLSCHREHSTHVLATDDRKLAPQPGRAAQQHAGILCSVTLNQPNGPTLELERVMRELQPLAARHAGIAAVWIFGSAVRSELRFDSDVDIAVLFRPDATMRDTALAEFSARLEAFTSPYPVAAVDLGEQGVIFAHEVLCTGKLAYVADDDYRARFESSTCVRAFDFRPTYELALRGQREGLVRRLERQ
jgi:predicted nucleotidyltransferase